MAYNFGVYNLTRYNIAGDTRSVFVSGSEKILCNAILPSAIYHVTARFSEKITAAVVGKQTVLESAYGAESIISQSIKPMLGIYVPPFTENVQAETDASAKINININANEKITEDINIGAVFASSAKGIENISQISQIGQNASLSAIGHELIMVVASLEATDEFTAMVNITLKPGQRLILDSVNFNAYLDDENIIDRHSGDWITSLSRNTEAIRISAESGQTGLQGEILYTERYL